MLIIGIMKNRHPTPHVPTTIAGPEITQPTDTNKLIIAEIRKKVLEVCSSDINSIVVFYKKNALIT